MGTYIVLTLSNHLRIAEIQVCFLVLIVILNLLWVRVESLANSHLYAALLMDHGILTRMDSIDSAAGVLSLTTCTLRVNIIHQERC